MLGSELQLEDVDSEVMRRGKWDGQLDPVFPANLDSGQQKIRLAK